MSLSYQINIHPLTGQKIDEIFFVTVDTGLALFTLHKYLEQMLNKQLNEVYYQCGHFWMGSKAITKLHKITFLSKEQHQLDLLYVPHTVFEGNTHKHTGILSS